MTLIADKEILKKELKAWLLDDPDVLKTVFEEINQEGRHCITIKFEESVVSNINTSYALIAESDRSIQKEDTLSDDTMDFIIQKNFKRFQKTFEALA